MKIRSSLSIVLILSTFAHVPGQNPAPSTTRQPQQAAGVEDEDVVRISANLVQVDAVITDQKGKQVTDLQREDFEIYEDGRPQKITNFSYVSNEPAALQPSVASAVPRDKNAPPVPSARLRPEQVRRTIALVVDDLGLSFESGHFVRSALKKFVDEQMQPTDLVAIIRTGGGMGALQQFTSDKRQLYAAIERVRWNPQGRAGISAFAPIGRELDSPSETDAEQPGRSARDLSNEADQFREELFTVGTLGALNYIIRGLKELPGRKSVLLISDGFNVINTPHADTSSKVDTDNLGAGRNDRVLEALRRLTDLANRASVVIYTMDPRGLPTLGFSAEDNVSNLRPDQIQSALANRSNDYISSQDGPNLLARETGGFSIRNTNDLSAGVRQVLDDQKGYYLIGYRPEESTFDPKTGSRRFHDIKIKVKREGLRVRSRNGFYGVANEETRAAVPHTRVAQLTAALTSPFNSNGIGLRLTSLFSNDPKTGSFIRSLLHIDGRDLTFTKEADGWSKAVLDVLVITFGDNGTIVDQITNTYTVRVRGKTYERATTTGFTYTINLPVKKAGAYQLRVALRDSTSERVGAASQFIEVPDMSRNRLTLSGIVVSGHDPLPAAASRPASGGTAVNAEAPTASPTSPSSASQGTDDASERTEDPQATPSVRRFARGMVLQYDYVIFNAKVDKAATTSRPQLQTQVRLFRDGQPFFTGKPKPLDIGNQTDLKRLIAGGALRIGTDMTPGEYVLQVIVTDALAKDQYREATQWIDFDIVR
jgi:VWFA-related protein